MQPITSVAADPADYGQVFINAWLCSTDNTATPQARRAQSLSHDLARHFAPPPSDSRTRSCLA